MEHEHSAEAIKQRLAKGPTHNYLRDWIYGGIDGSCSLTLRPKFDSPSRLDCSNLPTA